MFNFIKIARKYMSISIGVLIGLKALTPIASAAPVTNPVKDESNFLLSYEDGIRIKTKPRHTPEGDTRNVYFNTELRVKEETSLLDLGVNINFKSKSPDLSNYVNLGILLDEENMSKAITLFKAGYGNKFALSKDGRKLLSNDAQIKAGVLYSENKIMDKKRPTQFLLGFKDTICVPLLTGRTSLDAILGAELISASSEGRKRLSIDSYATEAALSHTSNLFKRIAWHNKVSQNAVSLNKDRYFFLDRKIEQKATTALGYNSNNFKVVGLFTAEKREDEDSIRKTRTGLKMALCDWLFKSYVEKSIVNNKGRSSQYFASVRKDFKKVALELFYSQKKSKRPWLGENDSFAGFLLSFGLGKSSDIAKLMEDDLSDYEKDNFYDLTAYKDSKLTFKESVEQLDSIRKINEWAPNLQNRWRAFTTRSPADVYSDRGGGSDEQANWFSYIAKKHGYKAHILDYCVEGKWTAHSVSLVEDKKGNTFVSEYGEVYKIDVDKNASLEEKAKAALNQCGKALALAPIKNKDVYFLIFEPSEGDYLLDHFLTIPELPNIPIPFPDIPIPDIPDINYNYMTFKGGEPKNETGVRILLNDRFFK